MSGLTMVGHGSPSAVACIVAAVHILVATDARYVADEIIAVFGGLDTSFTIVREGRKVADVVEQRMPDLAVLDLQIGSMGGMAVTMSLRLDESAGRFGRVPVLMLLDRQADVHLAKRCDADDWLVKPLDALGLKRSAKRIAFGPLPPPDADVGESAEAEPAPAG
jgi:CheY-like chemotaxis protein